MRRSGWLGSVVVVLSSMSFAVSCGSGESVATDGIDATGADDVESVDSSSGDVGARDSLVDDVSAPDTMVDATVDDTGSVETSVDTAVCKAGDTRCTGGLVETCDPSGHWGAATKCTPPAGDICLSTGCEFCPSGTTACADACVDTKTDSKNCTACGNVCAPQAHATPRCAPDGCKVDCDTGFLDCNPAVDGCEVDGRSDHDHCGACAKACAADELCTSGACACDATYVADGSKGVFVAPTGNDTTGAGTAASPYATIAKGISAAIAGSKANVYLAPGTYAESVTIADSPAGLWLQGGFSVGTTWRRNCAVDARTKTVIQGGAVAVSANNVTHDSGIAHATVLTPATAPATAAGASGASQIGVRISGAGSKFHLDDVDVVAGPGGAGGTAAKGANGSSIAGPPLGDGAAGPDGMAGASAAKQGDFSAAGFTPANGSPGGKGGDGHAGVRGPMQCQSYNKCGAPSACGAPCSPTTPATACSDGGADGYGGGGASGGAGGLGGGASVGVLVYGSGAVVTIESGRVESKNGGAASPGGAGGAGGAGLAMGSSGPLVGYYYAGTPSGTPCSGLTEKCVCNSIIGYVEGGPGGPGGKGGAGGAGGRGAGGPSYAVVTGGGATATVSPTTTLVAGAGGDGAPVGGSATKFTAP